MNARAANFGTAAGCKDFGDEGPWPRLAAAVEKIFPRKTALNFADISGLKERAAYAFLAGKSALSSDAVVSMLNSVHGPELLKPLLRRETVLEREFREMFERKRIEAQIAELQGRLAALSGGGK